MRQKILPKLFRYTFIGCGVWALGYWGIAPMALNHAMSQIFAEAEREGITITADQKGIRYFPKVKWSQFNTTLTFKNGAVVKIPDELAMTPHPLTWFLGELKWRTRSPLEYTQGALHLTTAGTHIRLKSRAADLDTIKMNAERLEVKASLASNKSEILLSRLKDVEVHLSSHHFTLASQGIEGEAVAEGISNINLEVFAEKKLPPLTAKGLQKWFDADDSLEIKDLSLNWNEARFALQGTLSLDKRLQPLLSATMQIDHFGAFLKSLIKMKMISKGTASTIESIALLLPGSKKEGDKTHIHNLPLTIQDRVVSLGPVNIAEIPVIVWP